MKQFRKCADFCKRNRHILYILPWLLGFCLFQALPMLWSLRESFTDFHLFRGITKTGFFNYDSILHSTEALNALGRTLLYMVIVVPCKLTFALLTALLLTKRVRGIRTFRTLYYLPSILGGSVAAAVLWKALFRENGVVNHLLAQCGISVVPWLSSSQGAMAVLVLLRVWEFGSPMLLFLAALQEIPQDLEDAARLDGAGHFSLLLHVKLPMISPILWYNILMQCCAALQEFNAPFVITGGGPRGATTFFSLLLYRSAFTAYEMGYASALAWVLFLVTAVISGALLFSRRFWVFYREGGDAE